MVIQRNSHEPLESATEIDPLLAVVESGFSFPKRTTWDSLWCVRNLFAFQVRMQLLRNAEISRPQNHVYLMRLV